MAYDEDTAIVLWPEYFDRDRTRAAGRRMPKDLCVSKPRLDIMAKGAMILDLEYRVHEEMCYPGNWTARGGCIKVEKGKLSKTGIMRSIGETLVANS